MMKDKDFYTSAKVVEQQSKLPSFIYRDKKIIGYLKNIDKSWFILDIGEKSPLTERIEKKFNVKLDSTTGDLDREFDAPYLGEYDLIIFSHVIEHLFNPLFCLENIKRVMKPDGILIICTPIKPHFIPWGRGHFHEMDDYRFKKLIERSGLKIIKWDKFRNGPLFTNIGIRPILRKILFREQSFVVLRKSHRGEKFNPYSTQSRTEALEMEERAVNKLKRH